MNQPIYKISLAGDVWLAASSVSLRRPASGAYLSIVCPVGDADLLAAVLARDGEDLVLWRGTRAPDGTESLIEMESVPLSSAALAVGANSASLTISGRSQAAYPAAATRAVSGISYRNTTGTGRTVRADVVPDMVPGDTADLGGGETMTVGSVTITLSTSLSSMELSEAE